MQLVFYVVTLIMQTELTRNQKHRLKWDNAYQQHVVTCIREQS